MVLSASGTSAYNGDGGGSGSVIQCDGPSDKLWKLYSELIVK